MTGYLCISCTSRGRPVRWWNRYASTRCYSISFLFTRAGWHKYDCSGRGDMLLNHKHYFVSQRMRQNNDQYFQATNTFQRHPTTPPTHKTIPSVFLSSTASQGIGGVGVVLKRGGDSQPLKKFISFGRI